VNVCYKGGIMPFGPEYSNIPDKRCRNCEYWKKNNEWGDCELFSDPKKPYRVRDLIDFDIRCQCNDIERVVLETNQGFGCVGFKFKY